MASTAPSAASTAALTSDEAMALIESASTAEQLFGPDEQQARQAYRRLTRLVHPDANTGANSNTDANTGPDTAGESAHRTPRTERAARAFTKLSALWQQHRAGDGAPQARSGGSGGCSPRDTSASAASGDIASVIRLPAHGGVPAGVLKLARDPADGDLIGREAAALRWIAGHGDPAYLPYVPTLVETRRYADPATGVTRRGNVLAELSGFVTLEAVGHRFPAGLDPRDVAWIWRRALVALGFAHHSGLIHGAVLPRHLLIHPNEHGLCLIDWCYSSRGPNPATLPAIVARYRHWYPGEVGPGHQPGPDLDIYLATKSVVALIRKPLLPPLAAFAAGCTLASPARRPSDAWKLLREFDDLIERLWGPRRFRPFPAL
ncbi:MAG: heat shock protein DnaJ domain protein [Actinomycetia bacterium]|nr:heat shock protein DnaJ domain protein [Actinomycetes bacterium]